MTQLEKRIQRLESLYELDQPTFFGTSVQLLWPEMLFLHEFPLVFPDPNTAPPIARMTYFKLKKWVEHARPKNPSQTAEPNFPKTERKEDV